MILLAAGIFILLVAAGHAAYHLIVGWLLWREEKTEKEFRFFDDPIEIVRLIFHGVFILAGIVLIVLHFAGVE